MSELHGHIEGNWLEEDLLGPDALPPRRRLRRPDPPSLVLNVTSMIDVIFLLLTYFMLTAQAAELALSKYGIRVVDVRLRRLNLPDANKQSVFDRMRAERDRIARKYRAEGEEEARRVRAEADRTKDEILSAAYRDSERVKGEGEAAATRIYAAAHNADPEFYKFTRTLEAYDKLFEKNTTVVLSADSPLLRTLSAGPAAGAGR